MIEDMPNAEMPERSRLFSLPMKGLCGGSQESLFDYAQRLSVCHQVNPAQMFCHVLLPEAGRDEIPSSGTVASSTLVSINGVSRLALDFASAMNRLTSRTDLAEGTFLAWKDLLPSFRFAQSRRWCAHCLASQADPHRYFSLCWSLEAVAVCPVHLIPLSRLCGVCRKPQPRLSAKGIIGCCAHCGRDLADSVHSPEHKPTERALHAARSIAEMIEGAATARALATLPNYAMQLKRLAKGSASGTISGFARELHVSTSSISPRKRPQLTTMLELTYRLGMTPLGLISGDEQTIAARPALEQRPSTVRRSADRKAHVMREAKAFLSLVCKGFNPLPLRAVCRHLSVSLATLDAQLPEEMKALRTYNRRAKPRSRARQAKKKVSTVRAAMQELAARGLPRTGSDIRAISKEFGINWLSPKLMREANEYLAGLLETR